MTTIRSLCSLTLDFPPSCIEFSRVYPECFVIGTYFLEQQKSSGPRDGDGGSGDEAKAEPPEQSSEVFQRERMPQQRSGSLILLQLLDGSQEGTEL